MRSATRAAGSAVAAARVRGLVPAARCIALAASLAFASGPAATQERWIPPLAPPLRVTGTFGESRGGHLHSGVDFSTGGTIGRPVRAVAAGSIVRMRAGAFGYGRALYLDLGDGRTVVYGHLDRFAPALEAHLRLLQQEAGEYEVDLEIAPGRLRIAAGETLAFSGETGSGPPHLHFEMRVGEVPGNPLGAELVAADSARPLIGALGWHALDAESWIDEGMDAPCRDSLAHPVRLWGRVGVECLIIDGNGETDARLAPQRVELALDDSLLFTRDFALCPYERGSEVRRIYGAGCPESGPFSVRLYRWPPGALADVAEVGRGDGWIDAARLAPGAHTLRVSAEDAAGGRSVRSWRLEVAPPLRVASWAWSEAEPGSLDLEVGLASPFDQARLPLFARLEGAPERAEPLEARAAGFFGARVPAGSLVELCDGRGSPLLPGLRAEIAATDARWRGGPPACEVHVKVTEGMLACELLPAEPLAGLPRAELLLDRDEVQPLALRGRGAQGGWSFAASLGSFEGVARRMRVAFIDRGDTTLSLPALLSVSPVARSDARGEALRVGPLTVQPGPDTFFGAAILAARLGSADEAGLAEGPQAGELVAISPLAWIEPETPLAGPIGVFFDASALTRSVRRDDPAWGLYRRSESGRWRRSGRESGSAGLGARVTETGCYALLLDLRAPAIGSPRPGAGARLAQAPAELRVSLSEQGSGIDPRRSDILLDGRMLLAAYDADAGELWAEVPAGLTRGEHAWEVRATDRAGHTSARSYAFIWVPR